MQTTKGGTIGTVLLATKTQSMEGSQQEATAFRVMTEQEAVINEAG